MPETSRSDTDPAVNVTGVTGGLLAIIVSIAVGISLPLRDVDYNALNLFTIVGAACAGAFLIRGSKHPNGVGLGWGILLLGMAMLPAMYGWVGLLYLPSMGLALAATARFVTRSNA